MNWYHSGLEGLCDALAGTFGNALKASFARDLFNDDSAFDNGYYISRIWTLSRTGRIGKFERSWTGESLEAKHRNELTAKHALDRFTESFAEEGVLSELYSALACAANSKLSATEQLHSAILKAMADGFTTERYSFSVIMAFTSDMDALARTWDPKDVQSTKEVARRLVAAAIYGPNHPSALSNETRKTAENKEHKGTRLFDHASTSSIVVTHIYDGVAAKVGACCRYPDDQIILLGRSSQIDRYRSRIKELNIYHLLEMMDNRTVAILRIPEIHELVSSCHGALACEEGIWYYYDLDPKNGTMVSGGKEASTIDGMCEIQPGDVIFLGSDNNLGSDEILFWNAAAILVSMSVDPGCLKRGEDEYEALQ